MGFECFLFGARACRVCLTLYPQKGISHVRNIVVSSRQYGKLCGMPQKFKTVPKHSHASFALGKTAVVQSRNVYSVTATSVAKDVILFEHDRTRLFRFLAVFCGGQLLFWTYLAHFAYTGLRDTQKLSDREKRVRTELGFLNFDLNLGSSAWRIGFTLGCLGVGFGILGLGLLFSRRSVSRVILHKGGGKVTVTTQSPLGPDRARCITLPLSQVSCHAHRQESPSYIPLKVKGYKLYFLLDKEGTINNPRLFDITVGAYRRI
ncbi:transmembrane protein 223 [Chanos chanos]|uniref:Transmembrane protein 223 n=1 Tax=Chanos chanos TaxID=29144 RepID=A0A6J2W2C8_CHACN|nr:transmembrane protein 223 [Chanos chanos]